MEERGIKILPTQDFCWFQGLRHSFQCREDASLVDPWSGNKLSQTWDVAKKVIVFFFFFLIFYPCPLFSCWWRLPTEQQLPKLSGPSVFLLPYPWSVTLFSSFFFGLFPSHYKILSTLGGWHSSPGSLRPIGSLGSNYC